MPKEVECFWCDEKFVTSSAMVLHLESGYCRCQIDCNEIRQLVYECYQASHYINGFDNDKPFRCEYCNGQFGLMSALLQHLETDYCDGTATYDRPIGRFLNFLRMRIWKKIKTAPLHLGIWAFWVGNEGVFFMSLFVIKGNLGQNKILRLRFIGAGMYVQVQYTRTKEKQSWL